MALPKILQKLFQNDGYGPKIQNEIIPFATSLASDSASEVASTEWVKDLAITPVYVDASKSSGGDGLTPETAVPTFAEAIEISMHLAQSLHILIAAGGTYTGDIHYDDGGSIRINLTGDVTVNGCVSIGFGSILTVRGSGYEFNVNSDGVEYGALRVGNNATVDIRCKSSTFTSANSPNIVSVYASKVFITNPIVLNAGANISSNALSIVRFGLFETGSTVTINNGSYANAVVVNTNSYFNCGDKLSITATNSTGAYTIYVFDNSNMYLNGGMDLKSSPSSSYVMYVEIGSTVVIVGGLESYSRMNNQSGHHFGIHRNSSLFISGPLLKLDCSTNCVAAFVVSSQSSILIQSAALTALGKYTNSFVVAFDCGYFELLRNTTITDNTIAGTRKFYAATLSVINTQARSGQNYPGECLPGDTRGDATVRNAICY